MQEFDQRNSLCYHPLMSLHIEKGERITGRPPGFLKALAMIGDIDGWGMTLMERESDGKRFIKRGKLQLANKRMPYLTEWYETNQQKGDIE